MGAGRVNASFQVGATPGASTAANANTQAAQQASDAGSGGGGNTPSSILDILTSPVDTIGGWLAGIALNLVKDVAVGFVDIVILPAWHWNERVVDQYQKDMFTDKSGKQLLWTAAFWGGGYWLLFTDPNKPGLAPQPVRNSRIARHTRFAQSLPARKSLVKPKDVKGKTPKKPKEVTSRVTIEQTGKMATQRHQTVKVTGTHARTATESDAPIESEATVPTDETRHSESSPEYRAGTRPLPRSRRNTPGATGTSRNRRGES